MTEKEKNEILLKAKDFFTNTLVANHKKIHLNCNLNHLILILF